MTRTLTFRLEGTPADDGLVRVSEFIIFVEGVLSILRRLEVGTTRKRGSQYRIVDLELGSAVIAIEPIPSTLSDPDPAVRQFVESIAAARAGTLDLQPLDAEIKRSLNELFEPLRERRLSAISLRVDNAEPISLQTPEANEISLRAGPETAGSGFFTGHLDAINVHDDDDPHFYLYPVVAPRRIPCRFDRRFLDDVRAALKRFVTVHGLMEYAQGSAFPSKIWVEQLEVHPLAKDLPRLASLLGSVPDIMPDGVDSVAYVRALRDADK